MLSIGEFSKLTGLSSKTLIWYDNIGLLKPDFVNEENGYRFYELESINKVAQIQFWQTLDFTLNELKNLSNEMINEKIKQLELKIQNIQSNIFFLQKLMEENNMNKNLVTLKENFNAFNSLLSGKWNYVSTVKSLKDVLENKEGTKDKNNPRYLFFSENGVGTDLISVFNFYSSGFTTSNNVEYHYFLLNASRTMVIYTTNSSSKNNKNVKLHVYHKFGNYKYNTLEIEMLLLKYKNKKTVDPQLKLNQNLIGNWKIFDQIRENSIDSYNEKLKTKSTHYLLSPMFDVLDISEDKSVYIMAKNKELNIKYSVGDTKTFNRENTKMEINMCDENTFVISKPDSNLAHHCFYKQINGTDYIFANLEDHPDLNELIYVFKKSNTNKKK